MVLDKGEPVYFGNPTEATKSYQLMVQEESGKPDSVEPLNRARTTSASAWTDSFNHDFVWPDLSSFLDLSMVRQISNGWARCSRVALCDENGQLRSIFEQGSRALFYSEFDVLEGIEVPSAGIAIRNRTGVAVYAKHSLQMGTRVPTFIPKGSRLRFCHDVMLDLACGEYTFDFGLINISHQIYERKEIDYETFLSNHLRLCEVTAPSAFTVILPKRFKCMQLRHFGLANLEDRCHVSLIPTNY